MLHGDFAESYKNDEQDAIQSAYFGNQCFRVFTAFCYAKSPNNNDVRKVKSDQLVVHSPLEVSEAVTIFVSSIDSVYLPENENIVEPGDMARKIDQTLKIHKLERKCIQNGDT